MLGGIYLLLYFNLLNTYTTINKSSIDRYSEQILIYEIGLFQPQITLDFRLVLHLLYSI